MREELFNKDDKTSVTKNIFNVIDQKFNVYNTLDTSQKNRSIPLKKETDIKFKSQRKSLNKVYQKAYVNAVDNQTLKTTMQLDELNAVKKKY